MSQRSQTLPYKHRRNVNFSQTEQTFFDSTTICLHYARTLYSVENARKNDCILRKFSLKENI